MPEFVKRKSELYPTNAYVFARMSYVSTFRRLEGCLLAQEKVAADDENPHLEFKLSNRRLCEVEFAAGRTKDIF